MNTFAGSLPEMQLRRPRKSFARINRTMPMLCSRGMDWPTSATSGGFRPPGVLCMAQHITCSAPPSRRLSSTFSCSGHRSYSDVRNRIDVPSDTQI